MPLIFVMLSPAQPALIIPSDNTDRGRPPQMRTLDNFSYDNYKELPSQRCSARSNQDWNDHHSEYPDREKNTLEYVPYFGNMSGDFEDH